MKVKWIKEGGEEFKWMKDRVSKRDGKWNKSVQRSNWLYNVIQDKVEIKCRALKDWEWEEGEWRVNTWSVY